MKWNRILSTLICQGLHPRLDSLSGITTSSKDYLTGCSSFNFEPRSVIISPAWQNYAARKRLGVEAIEIPSGHYPHLSHTAHLAEVLLTL